MADRIMTTQAGSLPRPADLVDLMWAKMSGRDVDEAALEERFATGVEEVVARQREVGIDIVGDGELSRLGLTTYVGERFSGFDSTERGSDDGAPFPSSAMRMFATDAMVRVIKQFAVDDVRLALSSCVGPVELTDRQGIHRDIANLKAALGDAPAESAFMASVSPGQIACQHPNRHYASHEEYLGVLADALSYEYQAIVDAGLNLQIDAPDLTTTSRARLPLSIEAINAALEGISPERVRLHVSWDRPAGPHHRDVPFSEIVDEAIRARVGAVYPEGGNPRHEHEWRVFADVDLPEGMKVILGVIDTRTNDVEHPQVVADRLVRVGRLIGRDRLMAGTDSGFGTYMKFCQVDPEVAWSKLRSLVDGAELATRELS